MISAFIPAWELVLTSEGGSYITQGQIRTFFYLVSTHVKSHGCDSPTQRDSRSEGCFLPSCSQGESQEMGPNNGKNCLVPSPITQEKNSWARVMGSLMQLDG